MAKSDCNGKWHYKSIAFMIFTSAHTSVGRLCRCYLSYTDNLDCSTALKNIIKNYNELKYLPINSMLGKLYSKEIVTFKEKEMIESKPTQSERMVYFLDHVIIHSLAVNVDVKFRGFVEVMIESGDPTLKTMAAKLTRYVCM